MPKKSAIPLEIVTSRLYAGDKTTLQSFYPDIGYNTAIRELVHRHCRLLLEREARESPQNLETPNDGTDGHTFLLPGDSEPVDFGQAGVD